MVDDTEMSKRLCLPCEGGLPLLIWLLRLRDSCSHLNVRRGSAIVEQALLYGACYMRIEWRTLPESSTGMDGQIVPPHRLNAFICVFGRHSL